MSILSTVLSILSISCSKSLADLYYIIRGEQVLFFEDDFKQAHTSLDDIDEFDERFKVSFFIFSSVFCSICFCLSPFFMNSLIVSSFIQQSEHALKAKATNILLE